MGFSLQCVARPFQAISDSTENEKKINGLKMFIWAVFHWKNFSGEKAEFYFDEAEKG